MRILPIGDSLTRGSSNGGYRAPLHRLLVAGGYAPEWLGPLDDHAGDLPLRHAGYGGSRIDALPRPRALLAMSGGVPELVALLIGTNDAAAGLDEIAGAPDRLLEYVDELDDELRTTYRSTGHRVLVAALPPIVARAAEVHYYNREIVTGCWARRHGSVRIVAAMASAYSVPMTIDGTHPGQVGWDSMASRWYSAIRWNAPSVVRALAAPASVGAFAYGLAKLSAR